MEVGCKGFPAQSVWSPLTRMGLRGCDKKTAAWEKLRKEPPVGAGIEGKRWAGSPEEKGKLFGHHCQPTSWRVSWLRVKALDEGWALPDDISCYNQNRWFYKVHPRNVLKI